MEPTCLYHPTEPMRVISDEGEFNFLLSTGAWFKHPTEAQNMRNDYEKRISESSSGQSVRDEGTTKNKSNGRKRSESITRDDENGSVLRE